MLYMLYYIYVSYLCMKCFSKIISFRLLACEQAPLRGEDPKVRPADAQRPHGISERLVHHRLAAEELLAVLTSETQP